VKKGSPPVVHLSVCRDRRQLTGRAHTDCGALDMRAWEEYEGTKNNLLAFQEAEK
jgi:hypothetical protein